MITEVLEAVKDRLVAAQPTWIENRIVAICRDGQPPNQLAGFKDFFIGIHCTSLRPGETNDTNPGLHEVMDFECVISKKVTQVPNSALPLATWDATRGIYKVARQVLLALHDNWTLVSLANTALSGRDIITTAKWLGTDAEPEHKGPEWLGVEGGKSTAPDCLVVRVRFGGMERIGCSADVGGVV